jgi:triacylglycerol esterase/lipase EstA (alpha/beta hydrolase family)
MTEYEDGLIRRAIGAREKILWTGRPVQGLRLSRADGVLVPISLAFTACLLLALHSIPADAPSFVYVPFFLFFAAAFYLMGGRFFYDAFRRSQASYGLTNRLVVIVHGNGGATTECLELSTLPAMKVVPSGSTVGSIWFGTAAHFDRIENAQAVHDQVLAAQLALTSKVASA